MTVWCQPNTIFKERHALRTAGLIALCVALITTLFFGDVSRATAGINQTLSYSGRLLQANGSVVPDGHYNIQFKIYQDGDGTQAGDTGGSGGTLKWTETYINNGGTSGVEVTHGFFSVDLGSNNPFGSSVDWNQDTLWLSMNVAGSSTSCTTYNSGTCIADGEMLPMKRITSTPYAMNAGQLGGKTASNFVQLGQGIQADASTNSSIYINKTNTGNLVQLQNAGSDVFNITNSGDVQFGNGSNHSLYVGTAAASTDGSNLTLFAGYGGSGTGNAGGKLFLQGGAAGGTDGNGGDVVITGGAKTGTGANGGLYLGTDSTDTIQIGNTSLSSGTQTIGIGNNNTSGGTTNVTIGAGGSATDGTTAIQSKGSTTISTNGTTRATFDDSNNFTLDTVNQLNNTTNVSNNQLLGFGIQGASGSYTAESNGYGAYIYNDTSALHFGITPYATAGSSVSPTSTSNDALAIASTANGIGTLIKSGVAYGPNLIDNGGFEAGGCTGWKGCTFNNTDVHSGNYASQFVMTNSTSTNSLEAPSLLAAQPGDVFYGEGWMKTSATTTGTSGMSICYYDKDNSWLSCDNGSFSNPGTSWVKYTVTGSAAPANTAYVQIKFFTSGDGSTAGTWYFDDVYVAKVNHQESALYKNSVDSSNAFQIQDASANTLFNVNTSNGTISVGSDGSATSGTTIIQSKDDTTISTNGTQRARFSGSGNTLYLGNADNSGQAATASSFTVQGTSSTGADTQGGSLTIQAGAATNGNANGGNLTISGGAGVGTGASGLVVISAPTYTTASTQTASSDTDITQSNIDGFGVVSLDATADNVSFTLSAPTLSTSAAGRILYVTAANGSHNFMLLANVGGGAGVEQSIPLQQNTTATMIWSGSLWTVAGSGGSGSLQSAYNNSVQSTGKAEITAYETTSGNGLVIRDSSTSPTSNSILSVQSSASAPLLSVNSLTPYQLATNPGAETAGGSSSTFPADTWSNSGIDAGGPSYWDAAVSRYTTAGNNIFTGSASVEVATQNGWTGARNKLNSKLTPGVGYSMSFHVRTDSGSFTSLGAYYLADGDTSSSWLYCIDAISVSSTAWTTVTCTFTAPSSGITSNNSIFITPQTDTGTFYIDDLSLTRTSTTSNVQVGGNSEGTNATFFTLGKSASAPADVGNSALLGSMYYDTTIGKVQCYEANGWGSCGDKPDNFITISPEYTNAVTHGTDIGTLSSDLCSASLNINDGTSGQPTICGSNETYNFYHWTSAETSVQNKDIYVTYQLPSTFNNFIAGSTSLAGRTDSTDSTVAYQVYKNHSGSGLTACGSSVSVSTGSQSTWQTVAASGSADPSACSFTAGDSIVFKITLSSLNDANAYVSNLNFNFSNQ